MFYGSYSNEHVIQLTGGNVGGPEVAGSGRMGVKVPKRAPGITMDYTCLFEHLTGHVKYMMRLTNKLCRRPLQYAPAPCKLTFDLESGARVTCDVGYLCANFSHPRSLCSQLRPDVYEFKGACF